MYHATVQSDENQPSIDRCAGTTRCSAGSGRSPRRPGRRCRWRSRKRRNAAARRPAAALRSPRGGRPFCWPGWTVATRPSRPRPPRLWNAVPHLQGPRASGGLGPAVRPSHSAFQLSPRGCPASPVTSPRPVARSADQRRMRAAANIYRRDRALRDATASVPVDALGITGRPVFHRSAPRVPTGVLSGSMAFVSGNGRANEPATDRC